MGLGDLDFNVAVRGCGQRHRPRRIGLLPSLGRLYHSLLTAVSDFDRRTGKQFELGAAGEFRSFVGLVGAAGAGPSDIYCIWIQATQVRASCTWARGKRDAVPLCRKDGLIV